MKVAARSGERLRKEIRVVYDAVSVEGEFADADGEVGEES